MLGKKFRLAGNDKSSNGKAKVSSKGETILTILCPFILFNIAYLVEMSCCCVRIAVVSTVFPNSFSNYKIKSLFGKVERFCQNDSTAF